MPDPRLFLTAEFTVTDTQAAKERKCCFCLLLFLTVTLRNLAFFLESDFLCLVADSDLLLPAKSFTLTFGFRQTPIMADEPPTKRKCLSADCENDAGSLQCPTCLKLGIKDSYFCSQDCFKKNWVSLIVRRDGETSIQCCPAFPSFPVAQRTTRGGCPRSRSLTNIVLYLGHPQVNAQARKQYYLQPPKHTAENSI
jgi:hypothetical protein